MPNKKPNNLNTGQSTSSESLSITRTHPPRKAPIGFLAGNGAASAILLEVVLKPRAATLLLNSILEAPSILNVLYCRNRCVRYCFE